MFVHIGSHVPSSKTSAERARVMSTDLVANTMVVDGGAWSGTDGTTTGDPSIQEDHVHYQTKGGMGKVLDADPAANTCIG